MKIADRTTHAEAAEWFSQVRSGEISGEEDRLWRAWIDAGAHNLEAYENIELTWELCGELRKRPSIESLLGQAVARLAGESSQQAQGIASGRRRRLGLAAAAAILFATLTIVWLNSRVSFEAYEAGIGEQKVITLADQSIVTLNTRTRLRVQLSGTLRRVDLLNGEALFNVAKDKARPFEVHAQGGVSTAVGTEFDVHISDTAVQVTVLDGTVNVRAAASGDVAATSLAAGQTLDYSPARGISTSRIADINTIRGWQSHRIVLTDMALADALHEYNRYSKVPIVLGDEALAAKRINGVFRIDDTTSFVNALQQGLHVSATTVDGSIVLRSK